MSNKEIVANLLKQLSDSGSLYEIAREIEFVAGWGEGFESHEREGGTTIKKVKARVLL